MKTLMKFLFLIPLWGLLLVACEDIRKEEYPNGNVRISTTYVEDHKQGLEKEFYESGSIKAERTYLAGNLTDTAKTYFENGQIQSVIPYEAGAIQGIVTRYHENGQVASIALYAQGKIIAFPKEYEPNGKPLAKGHYEDSRDGKSYEWVRIHSQIWLAENMNFAVTPGSLCAQCNVWGRLYDFDAIQKACPLDFHVPTKEDWNILLKEAGEEPAKKLKANFGWDPIGATGNYGNGTNDFGFAVRASGGHFREAEVPMKERLFKDAGQKAFLWTAEGQVLVFYNEKSKGFFEKFNPKHGASLRCVLDQN